MLCGPIWLAVPPLAYWAFRAAEAAAAAVELLAGKPGSSRPFWAGLLGLYPTANCALFGGLFNKLSVIWAGKESANMPKPPRITVFDCTPNGLKAKPTRGSTATD